MTQKTFKRYELKFKVDESQFSMITEKLSDYMELDKYCKSKGTYMIYNIYFDTENDSIIRKSISKPFYKEKLRLRCYKIPSCDEDMVFLELKKKINGIVSKRRATMSYGDAKSFIENRQIPVKLPYTDNQVLSEISEFMKCNSVKPKVFLSYERIAFHGKENPDFRVTFDKNILTRRDKPDFNKGDFGTELLPSEQYLMEVKIIGSFPLWFAEILSEQKVYRTGFSKYGEEYKKYAKLQKSNVLNSNMMLALPQNLNKKCLTA